MSSPFFRFKSLKKLGSIGSIGKKKAQAFDGLRKKLV
jgi:hypothetical protein